MKLLHRTIETGHARDSFRHEVDDDIIEILRDSIRACLEMAPGHAIEIRPDTMPDDAPTWHLAAALDGGHLTAWLWYGEVAGIGDPCITMQVRPVSGGEYAAILDAGMAGIALLPDAWQETAALQAGDIERCIAWAWLADRPDPAT